VNAEFNVWLLIVGLVVGAGLAWLVMMDSRRRDAEVDAADVPREAAWLAAVMAEDGYEISPDAAEQLLLLHRAYLGAPPPDPIVDDADTASPERVEDAWAEDRSLEDALEDDGPDVEAVRDVQSVDGETEPSRPSEIGQPIERERSDERPRGRS